MSEVGEEKAKQPKWEEMPPETWPQCGENGWDGGKLENEFPI